MRDRHDGGHGGDDQERAVVFQVYLIISRYVSERPKSSMFSEHVGFQLGVALHISTGTFHTHGLL
jgi:hypothetical protein